jgi:DNA helicase-2/ATP-dependent DNA helicase PcrA
MMHTAYLRAAEELRANPGQWAAYESSGHCVVLAGPGSGKTKTLTIKLARMLAEDVRPPRGIACITYSNECARELRRRLRALGIVESDYLFIGTIHAFSLKHIVSPFASTAGLEIPQPLKVATQEEQRQAFDHAITKILGQSAKSAQFKVAIDAYRRTHLDRDQNDWNEHSDFAAVITEYENRLRRLGLIDFDDMMLIALRLVESNLWVRQALAAKFPILAVDEYQDLGVPLHRMVMSLCFEASIRLFAVGDADQSIYGFTGARPELLRELSERSDVRAITLPFNYRSAPEIVAAGEAVLGESRGYSATSTTKGIVDFHYYEEGLAEQASAIIEELIPEALERDKRRTLGDIAVLYNDQYDGNLISGFAAEADMEFVRIDNGAPIPATPLVRWLQDCAEWCAGGWRNAHPRLASLIKSWIRFNPSITRESDIRQIQNTLVNYLFENRVPDKLLKDWLEGFRELVLTPTFSVEGTLRDEEKNVTSIIRLTEKGKELEGSTIATFSGKAGSPHHLNLITMHSAKGLEYDVVFLLGMDQGRLPSWRDNTPDKKAEARRRFYVGVTRAKREVHLTYSGFTESQAGSRFHNGPSPFLLELQKRVGT